ncbi:hypothetical protein HLY00_420 [Mycolicibacterium hippocampi]|uniref:Uncharacterized protein n=1 Tax=Mycolicibacterium hippocampi TaxID=659824 RepID=A0A850PPH6_9MYCO|nr:hypothetical protein [Mycolicibacterium hippocampi]
MRAAEHQVPSRVQPSVVERIAALAASSWSTVVAGQLAVGCSTEAISADIIAA